MTAKAGRFGVRLFTVPEKIYCQIPAAAVYWVEREHPKEKTHD